MCNRLWVCIACITLLCPCVPRLHIHTELPPPGLLTNGSFNGLKLHVESIIVSTCQWNVHPTYTNTCACTNQAREWVLGLWGGKRVNEGGMEGGCESVEEKKGWQETRDGKEFRGGGESVFCQRPLPSYPPKPPFLPSSLYWKVLVSWAQKHWPAKRKQFPPSLTLCSLLAWCLSLPSLKYTHIHTMSHDCWSLTPHSSPSPPLSVVMILNTMRVFKRGIRGGGRGRRG